MVKLLVVGLDGATLDLIEPWAKQGLLPNLARLMQGGAFGRLQSVLPVLSSAAWGSFMTGVNPGKHGLFDFVKRAPDSYQLRPVDRSHLMEPTLWGILSQENRKIIVMNVPMTYPPEIVNGIMISGLGTPDYKTFTYPAELSKTLTERGYYVNRRIPFRHGDESGFIEETTSITKSVTDTALRLMSEQDWDLFMVVFRDPDEMAHFFWHFMDGTHPKHEPNSTFQKAIQDYYIQVDQSIGQLLDQSGPGTNVMIMSDHGTGPLYKDVYLNEWLHQKGWLALQDPSDSKNKTRLMLAQLGITRANISQLLRKYGLGQAEVWIKDLLGDRIEVLPKSHLSQFPEAIDWSRTRAYSFGYHGQIYINLRGREPQGIVEPGHEYDSVCEQIHQQLLELRNPDDNLPIVDQVYHRDQAFWGSAMADAPDLVVIMRSLSYITRSGYEFSGQKGSIFADPSQAQSGSHRMDGVWMLYGPNVKKTGLVSEQAGIVDLAPTILSLMGLDTPENMDGHVLDFVFEVSNPSSITHPKESYQKGPLQMDETTLDDQEKLLQRLKDLGYME